MTFIVKNVRFCSLVVLLMLPTLLFAARKPKFGEFNADHDTVEMFDAMKSKQINVKVIPKDSTLLNVMIENKTNKPLNVKLPEAFATVPALGQMGGMGGGQAGGGGMMGGGGGAGGGGAGGGFFNVPPEKVGKFKVETICLEHGKPEPRPAMKYDIKPLTEFTSNPAVYELCKALGTGRLNQRAAQVAGWHLMDKMSFHELRAKHYRYANGGTSPYFSPQQLMAGMQYATMARQRGEERAKTMKSPGETE